MALLRLYCTLIRESEVEDSSAGSAVQAGPV